MIRPLSYVSKQKHYREEKQIFFLVEAKKKSSLIPVIERVKASNSLRFVQPVNQPPITTHLGSKK